MKKMTNSDAAEKKLDQPLWRDYLELCKPNVVALMALTAVVGMLLAVSRHGAVRYFIVRQPGYRSLCSFGSGHQPCG